MSKADCGPTHHYACACREEALRKLIRAADTIVSLWMNRFLAARKVALYYYSLDENGVSKSLLAEQIAALDAEIEAKLKERTEK